MPAPKKNPLIYAKIIDSVQGGYQTAESVAKGCGIGLDTAKRYLKTLVEMDVLSVSTDYRAHRYYPTNKTSDAPIMFELIFPRIEEYRAQKLIGTINSYLKESMAGKAPDTREKAMVMLIGLAARSEDPTHLPQLAHYCVQALTDPFNVYRLMDAITKRGISKFRDNAELFDLGDMAPSEITSQFQQLFEQLKQM